MKDQQARQEIGILNNRINLLTKILETEDTHFPVRNDVCENRKCFHPYEFSFFVPEWAAPHPLDGRTVVAMLKAIRDDIDRIHGYLGVEPVYHESKTTLEKVKK